MIHNISSNCPSFVIHNIDTTFYSPPNMEESTPYGYYQYPGIKDDSTELVLKNKLPYFFREKSFVNFWMAEDLFDLNTDDNGGEILVEVYVLGTFDFHLEFSFCLFMLFFSSSAFN